MSSQLTASGTNQGAFGSFDWFLLLAAAAIWGSSFLFMDIALDDLTPAAVTAGRLGLGALALALVPQSYRTKVDRDDWPRVALVGLTWMAAPLSLYPIAQQWIDSAIAGMVNATTVVAAALFGILFGARRPSPTLWGGIVLGFIGVTMISLPSLGGSSSEARGVLLAVAASLLYGVAINVAAPLQQKYGAAPLMARSAAFSFVITLPITLWQWGDSTVTPSAAWAILIVGALGTGAAFIAAGTLSGRVGPTRASTLTYVIPIVALVLGVVFRGDDVAALAIAGVGVVLVGSWLASRRETTR